MNKKEKQNTETQTPQSSEGKGGVVQWVVVIPLALLILLALGFHAIFFTSILFLLYFIPSIIANNKDKKNFTAIFVVNIFLGWTVIGWIVALIWALTKD